MLPLYSSTPVEIYVGIPLQFFADSTPLENRPPFFSGRVKPDDGALVSNIGRSTVTIHILEHMDRHDRASCKGRGGQARYAGGVGRRWPVGLGRNGRTRRRSARRYGREWPRIVHRSF